MVAHAEMLQKYYRKMMKREMNENVILLANLQNLKILILPKQILPSHAQRHSSSKAAQLTHTAVKCRPHTAAEVYKYANHRCIQTQPSNREHQLS